MPVIGVDHCSYRGIDHPDMLKKNYVLMFPDIRVADEQESG